MGKLVIRLSGLDLKNLVFLDECSLNLAYARFYGWQNQTDKLLEVWWMCVLSVSLFCQLFDLMGNRCP